MIKMLQKWLIKQFGNSTSVQFIENNCLTSINQEINCTYCTETCPTNAISIIDGQVKFSKKNCIDCHLCIPHCPTGALFSESEILRSYEKKIAASQFVCFTCKKQKMNQDDIVLPCLSNITPELILIAHMYNKSVQIFYNRHKCKKCPLNNNVAKSMKELQELAYISYNDVEIINCIFDKNGTENVGNPKDILSFTKQKSNEDTKKLIFDSLGGDIDIVNREKTKLSERRKYLIEFLQRENKEKYLSLNMAKKLKLVKIKVNNKCDLCGNCAKQCPTGALKIKKNNDILTLTFEAIHCINCEVCSSNCLYIERSIDSCLCEGLTMPKTLKSCVWSECEKCVD